MNVLCPCCMPTICVNVLTSALLLLLSLKYLNNKSKLLTYIIYLTSAILLLLGSFLAILANSPPLRSQVTATVITALNQPGPLDDHRCPLVNQASGNVLEIGPGPGTNFRCLADNTNIKSWTGVEPNTFFADALHASANRHNIPFPINTVWLSGEDHIDVPPGSIDAVIATHVLCSVDSPEVVLANIARTLKTGGKLYFLEHVAAPPTASLYVHLTQTLASPIFTLVASGCEFRATQAIIEATLGATFDIQTEAFDAPMPLAPFVPHLKGVATKR